MKRSLFSRRVNRRRSASLMCDWCNMPKIPGIGSEQAVRVFEKLGYRTIRQGKHIVMSNGVTRLTIPRHKSIHAFTMGAIAADAGLSPEQFKKLM